MARYTVRTAGGRSFEAEDNESILDAALREGVVLPYSCRSGRCSTCRGRVLQGMTTALHTELGLSAADRGGGSILTCVRAAQSDVELDVEDFSGMEFFAPRMIPARIDSIDRLSHDVVRVFLRLPPTAGFRYHVGQYVDVVGSGGVRRSYSIANAPDESKLLEFHIRRVPGGEMSGYWFGAAAKNDLVRINGPLGTFVLGEAEGLDLVFLATGTGIAPVKAMLECLNRASGQPVPKSVTVLWGGRTPEDLYWNPTQFSASLVYVPVLSRLSEGWTGSLGYVQDVLLARNPDISRLMVYACGSDAMIHGAQAVLARAGLPRHRFRSDAFVCSAAA